MNPMDFLDEFQAEANEKLDTIATQLLRLERDATNSQPVREMFLAAHTIKGGAAMLRLTAVETLAHALEDLLSVFRDQERALDSATADLLFQTIDRLRELIAGADPDAVGAEVEPEIEAFAARLRKSVVAPVAVEVVVTPVTPATVAAASPRALVVDDSATVRELHTFVLKDAGFDVEAVERGDVALARAQEHAFEVVVAGFSLRGLDALALVRGLRGLASYASATVLLMSADATAEQAQSAVAAGATRLLRKGSLEDEQLTAALNERLTRAA